MDEITLKMSNFPLDYHLWSWQVAQVLPYLLDKCIDDEANCALLNEYQAYGFAEQNTVLGQTNMSKDCLLYTSPSP